MLFSHKLNKIVGQIDYLPCVPAGLGYPVNDSFRLFTKAFEQGEVTVAEAAANGLVAVSHPQKVSIGYQCKYFTLDEV